MSAAVSAPQAYGSGAWAAAAGELVAVCGLGGGLGTSTLAFALAGTAASQLDGVVLAADTGGPCASLALLAGEASGLELGEASVAIAAGGLRDRPDVELDVGLRLIARPPRTSDDYDPAALGLVLDQAQASHELTVVDCGTLQRSIEREVADRAGGLIWLTGGRAEDCRQARSRLDGFVSLRRGGEVLVARPGCEDSRGAIELAERLAMPLVLLPELAAGDDPIQSFQSQLRALVRAVA